MQDDVGTQTVIQSFLGQPDQYHQSYKPERRDQKDLGELAKYVACE